MALKTINKETKNTTNKTARTASRKTVDLSSASGRFAKNGSSDKKSEMSESDKLTLRAWKHTYSNRRKG